MKRIERHELVRVTVVMPEELFKVLLWCAQKHDILLNDEILIRLGESLEHRDMELNPYLVC